MNKRAILWDIDGTLINVHRNENENAHLRAAEMLLNTKITGIEASRLSGQTDFEIIKEIINQSNNINNFPKWINAIDSASADLKKKSVFTSLFEHDKIFGIINEHKIDNGIVTGNTTNRALDKLNSVNLETFFDSRLLYTCKGNVTRSEIVKLAKNTLFNLGYERFIIIGDTPSDILSAKKNGVHVVSVSTGKYDFAELSKFNPDFIFHKIGENEIFRIINFLISN